MAGLDEKQWQEVQTHFALIDQMNTNVNVMNETLIDFGKSLNQLKVDVTGLTVSLFGLNKKNGLNKDIKNNELAIKHMKDYFDNKFIETQNYVNTRIEKLKTKPGNIIKSWIPIIICIILFMGTVYNWVTQSIKKDIQQQQVMTAQPTP